MNYRAIAHAYDAACASDWDERENESEPCPDCGAEVVRTSLGVECTNDDCSWWWEPDFESMARR